MSNPCDPSESIGNYVPSSGTDANSDTKNADFVTLTCTSVVTDAFTLNGDAVFDQLAETQLTLQNESSVPGVTTFTGTVEAHGLTAQGNLNFDSTFLNILSPSQITGDILTPVGYQISNPSSTTLSGYIFNCTASTPPSYTAQTVWYIGKSSTSNNCFNVSFRNSGIGSTSNFLSFAPQFSTGLDIQPTSIKVNTLFQVKGVTIPPKTPLTFATLSSSSLTYSFNFSTSAPGYRRVVFHAIDVLRSASGTPFLLVGQGSVFSQHTYQGVTSGNNGSASLAWSTTGIPLWNATTSAAAVNMPHDIVVEFTYLYITPGYQVWSVAGYVALTGTSSTLYFNHLSGLISMTFTGQTQFSGLRLSFPAAPTSGYANVLVY